MEPAYPLWVYNLSYRQPVELKARPGRDDPIYQKVFLRLVVDDGDGQIMTPILGFNARSTVENVLQEINKRIPPAHGPTGEASREHYGLYLYNNTNGIWLEKNKPLSFYNISHMEILGFKEKSLYHIRLDGASETESNTLLLPCDIAVKNAIIQILSWVGTDQKDAEQYGMWLEDRGSFASLHSTIATYCLTQGDVLVVKRRQEPLGPTYRLKLIKAEPGTDTSAGEAERAQGSVNLLGHESYRLFPRLEGEVVVSISSNVLWTPSYVKDAETGGYTGDLYVTNYRLALFVPTFAFATSEEEAFLAVSLPLGCISRVEMGKQNNSGMRKYYLEVYSKDFRVMRFLFAKGDKSQRNALQQNLTESGLLFPEAPERLFAFFYKPSNLTDNQTVHQELTGKATAGGDFGGGCLDWHIDEWKKDGWHLFSAQSEFSRQGIPNNKWRLTELNKNYAHCESYPSLLAVPTGISDEELKEIFAFRSKGRIPVVCYRHPNNIVLARCSQPLAGLTRTRSMADEKLFRLLLENSIGGGTAPSQGFRLLYIMDARPRANAFANAAKGGGTENLQGYPQCKFEYLGIPNIHVIRESLSKLNTVCQMATGESDGGLLSALEATKWMDYIKLILEGAIKVALLIDEEHCPVTLHCSDGWDRTAQLSSLVQILLDPYFRTTVGFQVLIEKEWLSFGHKFSTRCGHGDKNHQNSQRAPIFLQFIDCVWQLVQQYPCGFQFNEKLLITILEHVYSCRFGTFLCDTQKQRADQRLEERTTSLWTYVNCEQNQWEYTNPFYVPDMSVLHPDVSLFTLSLWKGYHLRHVLPPSPPRLTPQLRILQLQNVLDGMKEQMMRQENNAKLSGEEEDVL